MALQLRKWDPHTISDFSVIVIIGKRGSGKSVVLKNIMMAKKHAQYGLVFSGTEDGTSAYGGKNGPVPREFVFSEFCADKIERLIERQKKLLAAGKVVPAFIILDDMMYNSQVMRSKCMRELFLNGRHYKLLVILTAQYAIDVPPYARGNVDWLITMREPVLANRQKLYKQFGGTLDSFDKFAALMDQTTENYECLVINQTSTSNDPAQTYHWFKGICPTPQFRMGSPAFWRAAAAIRNKRAARAAAATTKARAAAKAAGTTAGPKRATSLAIRKL